MDWFGLGDDSGEKKIKRVSEVSAIIKRVLDDESLHGIWVEGELTNFRSQASGHFYFSLVESVSGREYLLNCAMWRSNAREVDFKPESGMQVSAYGSIEVYEPHGKYQFIVKELVVAGRGDKYLLVAEWKRKLAEEGLFNDELKKSLPKFPKKVGVVTSSTGAARRDIENVISRRYPVEIILSPASVQGEYAHIEIAEALRRIDGLVDVIIVGRGGGSFEDLFPFNHPDVVRAVFDSKTPVVSAVGHEIDYTLTDLVADIRAPTPSAAAEIVVPDRRELLDSLDGMGKELRSSLLNRIYREMESLEYYRMHMHPRRFEQLINMEFQRLADLSVRLNNSIKSYVERERMAVDLLRSSLYAYNPEEPLKRGYSIIKKKNCVVNSVEELFRDDHVEIVLKDGTCSAIIGVVNYEKDI